MDVLAGGKWKRYMHLCNEPERLKDPVGLKRCERKCCPKLKESRSLKR